MSDNRSVGATVNWHQCPVRPRGRSNTPKAHSKFPSELLRGAGIEQVEQRLCASHHGEQYVLHLNITGSTSLIRTVLVSTKVVIRSTRSPDRKSISVPAPILKVAVRNWYMCLGPGLSGLRSRD